MNEKCLRDVVELKLFSQSLYLQAKTASHTVYLYVHTHTHTHIVPAASQCDKDFRFFYFLWTLNAAFSTPTNTQPHSNAHTLCSKQHSSIVSHECAQGRGGTSGALIPTFVLVWGMERVDLFGGAVSSVENKGPALTSYSACKAQVFSKVFHIFLPPWNKLCPLCVLSLT